MKKTVKSLTAWWDNNLLVGALSMLVVLLATELLFSVPSRWFNTESEPKIDIVREVPKTNLPIDETPTMCTKEYAPVCGEDGKTYGNKCMANAAKMKVTTVGECKEVSSASGETEDTPIDGTLDDETDTITDVTPPVTDADYTDTKKYHIYTNNSAGYSMAFPSYSWYYGFGARDGAVHSMAIALDEPGIATFDDAPVRVWFYRTKPATPPSDQGLTLENGTIYVSGQTDDPKIEKIISDIFASAK